MLKPTIKGGKKLQKAFKAESRRQKKALETAIKVTGFKLRSELKTDIRKGAPGGEKFAPLSFLARRKKGAKRFRPNKPLNRLAIPIAYHVKSKDPFTLAVGFTGPRVSDSWKKIAEKQQEGFVKSVTEKQGSFFRHRGKEVSKRSRNRKFFFLKDTTTQMDTPARPIVDPFWDDNRMAALKNIRNNFKRKMRGERI